MPADTTAADPGDRSNLCVTLTASMQTKGECGHVVRISRLSSTTFRPPTRAVTAKDWAAAGPSVELGAVHFPGPRHRRRSWKLMLTIFVVLIVSVTIFVLLRSSSW